VCDLAWVVLTDRIRATTLADRAAFLMAGEAPPAPEERVEAFRLLVEAAMEDDDLTPEQRDLRRLLGV
jgi:hypothetical protein